MKYIKKNKMNVLIDILVLVLFSFAEPTKTNFFLVLLVLGVHLFFSHVRRSLDDRHKAFMKDWNNHERTVLVNTIEELSCEIVYPQWDQNKKNRLLNEVQQMKKVVLGEIVQ